MMAVWFPLFCKDICTLARVHELFYFPYAKLQYTYNIMYTQVLVSLLGLSVVVNALPIVPSIRIPYHKPKCVKYGNNDSQQRRCVR